MNLTIDNTLNEIIDAKLMAKNKEKEANHKSSGKLSASMLSWPVQWQILKLLGVEQPPYDPYTLRKFKRGNDVEEWLAKEIPGIIDTQKFVEYRNTVGYIDVLAEKIHEIKSVTNAKYKWIVSKEEPDDSHVLQGALYAMALDRKDFAIDYVASDDLRVTTFIIPLTGYLKARIDKIIDDFINNWENKVVPIFEPLYAWQKQKMYSKYPEWQELSQEEIKSKMERLNINFP